MLFTSERVSRGHPDKICDQISDAIVTDCLKHDNHPAIISTEQWQRVNNLLDARLEHLNTPKPEYHGITPSTTRYSWSGNTERMNCDSTGICACTAWKMDAGSSLFISGNPITTTS